MNLLTTRSAMLSLPIAVFAYACVGSDPSLSNETPDGGAAVDGATAVDGAIAVPQNSGGSDTSTAECTSGTSVRRRA